MKTRLLQVALLFAPLTLGGCGQPSVASLDEGVSQDCWAFWEREGAAVGLVAN